MTNSEIIASALRRALAGEGVADIETLCSALGEAIARGEMHYVGRDAVMALLEYMKSDLQARRQALLAQNAAKRDER